MQRCAVLNSLISEGNDGVERGRSIIKKGGNHCIANVRWCLSYHDGRKIEQHLLTGTEGPSIPPACTVWLVFQVACDILSLPGCVDVLRGLALHGTPSLYGPALHASTTTYCAEDCTRERELPQSERLI